MLKYLSFVVPCIMMYAAYLCPRSHAVDLPDDLKQIVNISSSEDDTAYCMEKLKNCLNPHTAAPVCGINALTDYKLPFHNICEMIHENCRSKKEQWHYLSDEIQGCNGTFGNSSILRKKKKGV